MFKQNKVAQCVKTRPYKFIRNGEFIRAFLFFNFCDMYIIFTNNFNNPPYGGKIITPKIYAFLIFNTII